MFSFSISQEDRRPQIRQDPQIISDHLRSSSMRSKHVSINEPNHLERVLLKQASPMRTPTAYAEQAGPVPPGGGDVRIRR